MAALAVGSNQAPPTALRVRPLRYDGERPTTKGSYGANASYEHEWRISTWAFNLPGTFPHSAFRQRYGTPFDEGLLALVRGAGLLRLLELVKRQFEHALLARGAAAAAAVGAATLSQLFLTVQPHKQRMNDELASYMQSHYDPAAARLGSRRRPRLHGGRGRGRTAALSPSCPPRLRLWLAMPRCPGHAAQARLRVGGRAVTVGGEHVDGCSATARTRIPPGYSPPRQLHAPAYPPPMHSAHCVRAAGAHDQHPPLAARLLRLPSVRERAGAARPRPYSAQHTMAPPTMALFTMALWPSVLRCCTASTAASSRR